jgi:hypothetical protein
MSGLMAGYRSGVRMVVGSKAFLFEYSSRAFRNEKVFHVLREFCTEVAILVAVFPILETIMGRKGVQEIGHPTQNVWTILFVSYGIMFVFLILAIIIANRWG